jgi:hypothetical protein
MSEGIGVAATATGTTCGVDEAMLPLVVMASPPGEGRASLAAAHASARVSERSMEMDDDLWETYCISSTEELLIRVIGDPSPG